MRAASKSVPGHAPAGGYDFPAKHHSRKAFYAFVNRHCRVPPVRRKVLYLETAEGVETDYLLSHGYLAENLCPVNWNPAEMAHLTRNLRRRGVEGVQTSGVDVTRAVRRHDGANIWRLDFCGNVSLKMRNVIRKCHSSKPYTIVGVTAMVGREQGYFAEALSAWKERPDTSRWALDDEIQAVPGMMMCDSLDMRDGPIDGATAFRIGLLLMWLACDTHVIRNWKYETYMSGNLKMLWVAAEMIHADVWKHHMGNVSGFGRVDYRVRPAGILRAEVVDDQIVGWRVQREWKGTAA